MMDRQLFRETFSVLHASEDTITEVFNMAREQDKKTMRRRPIRTGALIALAAVLLMGSALAAVSYHLRTEPVGNLAVAVSVAAEGELPGAVAFSGEAADVTYHDLELIPGWLPEGMVQNPGETVKWSFEDNLFRGGFSLTSGPLNAGNATFCDMVYDAESQETLEIDGHEAFYVKMSGDDGFNQRMYISYPEYNAVLTIYIGADVDHAVAVSFAENLSVSASSRSISPENLDYIGRVYQDTANYIATGIYVNTADDLSAEDEAAFETPASIAAAENMVNEKQLGESYTVSVMDGAIHSGDPMKDLTMTVVDYAIADDVSILNDPSWLDSDVAKLLDENGKLPEDTLRFYVCGDGIDTPTRSVVAEQTQQPKLVAVTVDFTNDTDETMGDVVFRGQLMTVEETENGWAEYKPVPESGPVEYDAFSGESWETLLEMRYFDVHDPDSNGGNHILDLEPGETVTVQMAFVVNECEADHLWFYFDSGINDVREGYVDLRP